MNHTLPIRLSLMALLLLALLAALWAGLIRLGWSWTPLRPTLPGAHGPLMVSGFLGTLIALERAVALHKAWAYMVSLLGGLGALALIFRAGPLGPVLITLSSLGLVIISVVIIRRQPALYTAIMGLGALSWLVGNGLWLAGWPIARVVTWWASFLVLIIVGERLELSRLMQLSSHSHALFLTAIGLVCGGLLLSLFSFTVGVRLTSLGFVTLALWFARNDIARRTVRRPGLTRYIAVNLLLGYGWLAVSGVLGLRSAGTTAGNAYDAWLHALFLGFVFSMIFAHALVILPAVTGLPVPFHPVLYGPVLLMHLSLLLRVIGDLTSWLPGRQWGGLLNVVTILLFLFLVAALVARGRFLNREAGAIIPGVEA